MRAPSSPLWPSLLLAAAAPIALTPGRAAACGGFFCDGGGMPQPVDQTGENILFVVDDAAGTVEAHIQIQYTGDPIAFAWIIPVTAIPDFSAGSELLFTNLLAATAPFYSFTTSLDCQERERPGLGCGAFAEDAAAGEGGFFGESDGSATTTSGPEVVKREIVGPYEIVVLQGGTAVELHDWLETHGYAQDPDAPPIVEQYLEEGYYFAAARLTQGAGVDQLQPLVMTYEGTQPCVPLRLTRIAATDDMPIRVFALGDTRSVPLGYRHVEINQARLDWTNGAMNYLEVVGKAIDSEGADGRAFITEYAGTSTVVTTDGLFDSRWDPLPFKDAQPVADGRSVVDDLTDQGLMQCLEFDGCSYNHPLLLPILRTYLPTPPGVDEDEFYTCMSCYTDQIDLGAWDGPKFAQALDERIFTPGLHALTLVNRNPYLTRMLTVMSPEEMTSDPEFGFNPDLPDVTNTNTATMFIPCSGSNKMVLPSEEAILETEFGAWPDFDDTMPWARQIQRTVVDGAPQVEHDFSEAITAAIKASNKRFSYDNGSRNGCNIGPTGAAPLTALSLAFALGFAWRRRGRTRP